MNAAVSLKGLSYVYPAKRKSPERRALDRLSVEVRAGEIFGVLGPNGSGKSTLFKILSTTVKPAPGEVLIFGEDPALNPERLRARLGVVFQNPSLDLKLTAWENMMHQGRLYGLEGRELSSRARGLLDVYGLAGREKELVQSFSGGQRRRLELAKGLLHRPELLLMDEPSTGLDPGGRRDLWEHLKKLNAESRTTLIVSTHLMEEAELCGQLILLDEGRLVARGTPRELTGEIGGDVVSIESRRPDELKAALSERLGIQAVLAEGSLRIERKDGHSFIPRLIESCPGLIDKVSLSKPNLEDVFIRRTGRKFWRNGRGS